ncbi:MAG: response regulator [Desulfamplus sp.]|nr:response regulator [Desulfamplus sp.]
MKREYPPEKILSILKNSRLFSQFDEDQLIKLISFSIVEHFEQGSTVLHEGVHNENIYLLMEGSVAVYVGDELIMRLRRVGDILGEMSVINNSVTTASVVAETLVVLFVIPSGNIYDSQNPDIHSLWFKIFSDILSDKLAMTNKRLMGYQATSEELHSKKQELIQKTMILQSVMGSMTDGVVVADNQGKILHVNSAFVKTVGINDLPPNYHNWPEKIGLFKPDGKTLYSVSELFIDNEGEGRSAETAVPMDFHEIYIKNKYLQEDVWLHATSSTLKAEDGTRLGGTVFVFRDYTVKKHEEQALVKAKENAEATARAKSYFLSVMSHELRNPLNAILGMSNILQNSNITPEQSQYVETITKSGSELLDKIKNIMDFNHLESGGVELKKIPYSLAHLIEDTLIRYSDMAKEKQISVRTDISGLAKTGMDILIGDPERVGQILGHLVDNAIKFSSSGEVLVCVAATAGSDSGSEEFETEEFETEDFDSLRTDRNLLINTDGNRLINLEFEISDHGIGISSQQISLLFKPFSQADSSYRRKFEGTGLGLAICKRLIELMGGSIKVHSEFGRGARFIFNIVQSICDSPPVFQKIDLVNKPVVREKDGEQRPSSSANSKLSASYNSRSQDVSRSSASEDSQSQDVLKILVAEDNKVNQMLIKKILTKLGYSPVIVDNGLKAVMACEKEHFDLILMDIQMPEMDGLEASRKILDNAAKCRSSCSNGKKISKNMEIRPPTIVALTANIAEGSKEACLAAGMAYYMSKPLKLERLTEILDQLGVQADQ